IFKAETAGCDVIIVGRGGGSSEDLSAFNTEKVARAIYNCKVPVISAVGHETDFSIADLAADLRAPTPSAAAELAVPSIDSLYERIVKLNERAERSALTIFDHATERFISLNSRLSVQSPKNRLHLNSQKLENLHSRLKIAYERCLEKKEKEVSEKITRLDGLSPLKILSRGYSLTYKDEKLIRNSDDIEIGDELNMRFGSGGAKVKVIEKW
ncbi:MAG: exodeoxyribonuclease VII large subunit, partial [Ruminococcus sp.]|nr:exodeoxyribonuclease VII large subunit [Ruminococcus sp.]